jgi:hypothetical protein
LIAPVEPAVSVTSLGRDRTGDSANNMLA